MAETKTIKRKRILIFSTNFLPTVGGADVAIKEITDRISECEYDLITTRFTKKVPKQERIGNIVVHRIGLASGWMFFDKLLSPFLGVFKIIELTQKHRYDFFWCMMVTYTCGAAYLYNLIPFKRSISIILTLQEGDSETHLTKRHLWLNGLSWWLALRQTHFLTVISTYLEKRARRIGYHGSAELIPNGVEFKKYSTVSSRKKMDGLRRELDIKKNDVLLVTVSRLVEKNAVDDVIQSLLYLPDNVRFLVIGVGPDEANLKKLVKENGLEKRVLFLGWEDHDWMISYLHSSDVFVRPSLSEGFGNSFVEAMAAGVPVVATQVGGIADFLFDPERNPEQPSTGRAVSPRDPKGIARAVKLYLNDKQKTAEIVANAKVLVEEKYDWDLIAKDMKEKVFDQALKQR